jgi:hypothetical protein
MRKWFKAFAVGVAWAMCASALAEEQPDAVRAVRDAEEPFAHVESAPLDDERLAQLRGRRATPAELTQAGVVLWDEPRKGPPPVRNGGEPAGNVSVTSSFTIHFR